MKNLSILLMILLSAIKIQAAEVSAVFGFAGHLVFSANDELLMYYNSQLILKYNINNGSLIKDFGKHFGRQTNAVNYSAMKFSEDNKVVCIFATNRYGQEPMFYLCDNEFNCFDSLDNIYSNILKVDNENKKIYYKHLYQWNICSYDYQTRTRDSIQLKEGNMYPSQLISILDNKLILSYSDSKSLTDSIVFKDANTGSFISSYIVPGNNSYCVPEGSDYLVYGTKITHGERDSLLYVAELETGIIRTHFKTPDPNNNCNLYEANIISSDKLLYSLQTSEDGFYWIYLQDIKTGNEISKFPSTNLINNCLSPDKSILAVRFTNHDEEYVQLWDLNNSKPLRRFTDFRDLNIREAYIDKQNQFHFWTYKNPNTTLSTWDLNTSRLVDEKIISGVVGSIPKYSPVITGDSLIILRRDDRLVVFNLKTGDTVCLSEIFSAKISNYYVCETGPYVAVVFQDGTSLILNKDDLTTYLKPEDIMTGEFCFLTSDGNYLISREEGTLFNFYDLKEKKFLLQYELQYSSFFKYQIDHSGRFISINEYGKIYDTEIKDTVFTPRGPGFFSRDKDLYYLVTTEAFGKTYPQYYYKYLNTYTLPDFQLIEKKYLGIGLGNYISKTDSRIVFNNEGDYIDIYEEKIHNSGIESEFVTDIVIPQKSHELYNEIVNPEYENATFLHNNSGKIIRVIGVTIQAIDTTSLKIDTLFTVGKLSNTSLSVDSKGYICRSGLRPDFMPYTTIVNLIDLNKSKLITKTEENWPGFSGYKPMKGHNTVFTYSEDILFICNMSTGEKKVFYPDGPIMGYSVSDTVPKAVFWTYTKLYFYDIKSEKMIDSLSLDHLIKKALWAPDGKSVFVILPDVLLEYSAENRALIEFHTFPPAFTLESKADIDQEGKNMLLFTKSSSGSSINLYNLESKKIVKKVRTDDPDIVHGTLLDDNKVFVEDEKCLSILNLNAHSNNMVEPTCYMLDRFGLIKSRKYGDLFYKATKYYLRLEKPDGTVIQDLPLVHNTNILLGPNDEKLYFIDQTTGGKDPGHTIVVDIDSHEISEYIDDRIYLSFSEDSRRALVRTWYPDTDEAKYEILDTDDMSVIAEIPEGANYNMYDPWISDINNDGTMVAIVTGNTETSVFDATNGTKLSDFTYISSNKLDALQFLPETSNLLVAKMYIIDPVSAVAVDSLLFPMSEKILAVSQDGSVMVSQYYTQFCIGYGNTSNSVFEEESKYSLSDINQAIRIYPNPVSDCLSLHFKESTPDALISEIYNVAGILVKSESLNHNCIGKDSVYKLNVSSLDRGVYVLVVRDGFSTRSAIFQKD